jgi:antitoxin HigA-1
MRNTQIEITEIWNEEKSNNLKDFITLQSQKQTKERKLRNELLSIQYQIEDYIDIGNTSKN